ncbi:MAG: hypothetical protein DI630_12620 [Gordonia sp. (in: high G+C Gram-positive bacteria)]|nr:MAG: hypothetical protein DI630_12620 [Gordonia sp. (in: high G+C Gram-positive bacteria)]
MTVPTQLTAENRPRHYADAVDLLFARWLEMVNFAANARQLEDRADQSVNLRDDLDKLDRIVKRLAADITANAVRLKVFSQTEAQTREELMDRAFAMSRDHCRWIDYGEALVGAAWTMHESLAD